MARVQFGGGVADLGLAAAAEERADADPRHFPNMFLPLYRSPRYLTRSMP